MLTWISPQFGFFCKLTSDQRNSLYSQLTSISHCHNLSARRFVSLIGLRSIVGVSRYMARLRLLEYRRPVSSAGSRSRDNQRPLPPELRRILQLQESIKGCQERPGHMQRNAPAHSPLLMAEVLPFRSIYEGGRNNELTIQTGTIGHVLWK